MTYIITSKNKNGEKEYLAHSADLEKEVNEVSNNNEPAAGYYWTTDYNNGEIMTYARFDVAKSMAKFWNGVKVESI